MTTNSDSPVMSTLNMNRPCQKVKDDAYANKFFVLFAVLFARARVLACVSMCVSVWRDLHFWNNFILLWLSAVCGYERNAFNMLFAYRWT